MTLGAPTRRSKRQALKVLRQSKRLSYSTARLMQWQVEAERRSKLLNAATVWSMVDEFAEEARSLGLTAELRDVCFVAVGRMADPRGLRLTARYSRPHREEAAEYETLPPESS